MKNALYIVLFVLLGVACTPNPIELIIHQSQPKPVIYSQYAPGGLMAISLSKSFGALENKMPVIDSIGFIIDSSLLYTDCDVFINGQELALLDAGIYGTEQLQLANYQIGKLTIKKGSEVIANASAIKLPRVDFETVSATKNAINNSLKVDFSIIDILPEKNYYVVNYFLKTKRDTVPNVLDPEYIAKRMLQQNTTYDLFTDDDFKNGKYTSSKIIAANYESDSLLLSVSNIEKGFYHFLETQKKAGKLVNQIKSEVINFPTNISNGLGYLTFHEPDFRIILLQ